MKRLFAPLVLAAALLAGCQENVARVKPAAVEMTRDAIGYYCQMAVMEHEGPKAQVHLAGNPHPLWFEQVREAFSYLRSQERDGEIVALYVSDMGRAESWEEPGTRNWIDADKALFVIESRQVGGAGDPEAIPFGDRAAAEAFVTANGGRIVAIGEIPEGFAGPKVASADGTHAVEPTEH
ncbi:nitrous oxide reductase accessory protein NosL [Prosthecomicrobium sp. N25]|uniref:nitrous oxide reductase accessory protein NosL n=1 Tax=Prosthecomicrobium sp. N25 TaxID=3129254 RepID=UPI0030772DC7